MRLTYFDLIGGASGNMLLGALVDAGADFEAVCSGLRSIELPAWTARNTRAERGGIAATLLDFVVPGEDDHAAAGATDSHGRSLAEIIDSVTRSGLTDRQKERAAAIFRRLALAEATIHRTSPETVHFHEVGQTDAVLDIAGVCIALDQLEIEDVYCSAFPMGTGYITMRHGKYPNPAPAVAEMLKGFRLRPTLVDGEMVTPTGAAILTSLARYDTVPEFVPELIGYGAGGRDPAIPNVTRVFVGDAPEARQVDEPEDVVVLETNIDDMNPQHYELAIERVFGAGAIDVWLSPVIMKKNRPAVVFSAVAPLSAVEACAQALLRETTTLGVRLQRMSRRTLARFVKSVATPLGSVRVKSTGDGRMRRTLEYDDVLHIARDSGRPIAEVSAALERFLAEGEPT